MLNIIFTNWWAIQVIGVVALGYAVWAFQAKNRKTILIRQGTSAVLFVLHYLFLHAYTGALTNAVIIARNAVFEKKDTKLWAKSFLWVYVFMALAVVMLIFSWQGFISMFPIIGVLIGTYARWKDKASEIRLFSLVSASMWIPYTIVVHSYSGLLTQLITITFIVVAMYRLDR